MKDMGDLALPRDQHDRESEPRGAAPRGIRRSGVFSSPTIELPARPILISYLLRPQLSFPAQPGVVASAHEGLGAHLVHGFLVDALAPHRLVVALVRDLYERRRSGCPVPVRIHGALPATVEGLGDLFPAYSEDLAASQSLARAGRHLADEAVMHARHDLPSKEAWVSGSLGRWISAFYRGHGLTPTEVRVLGLRSLEVTTTDLLRTLGVSIHTLRHHEQSLRDKLGRPNMEAVTGPIISRLRLAEPASDDVIIQYVRRPRTPPDGVPI